MTRSHFLLPTIAIVFFLFICWIIYRADLGDSTPGMLQVRSIPFGDKMAHFLLYGLLAFWVNLALKNRQTKLFSRPVLLGAVLVAVFAVAEEFTQIALTTRNFEVLDIICDLLGIGLFSYFSLWVNKLIRLNA